MTPLTLSIYEQNKFTGLKNNSVIKLSHTKRAQA
jgi:hypothetical protein